MPKFVRFQTMVILDPYGMTYDAVGVFGPTFWLLSYATVLKCQLEKVATTRAMSTTVWKFIL